MNQITSNPGKPTRPQRIQRSRSRGWRMPPDTIYVGRPSKFGNPFRVEEHGREQAIAMYEEWLQRAENEPLLRKAREVLKGKNLGCWCRLDDPCHADVLLRLVNAAPPAEGGTPSTNQSTQSTVRQAQANSSQTRQGPRPDRRGRTNGWFEILYRYRQIPRLEKIEDLDPDDYMMVPGNTKTSTLPLNEFEGPFQAYIMIDEHWKQMGLPREPREYDIINMICIYENDPKIKPVTILMIDKAKNSHLIYPGANVQAREEYPLAQLPLKGIVMQHFRK